MEIKIMVVPGKIARVEVENNGTVLDACRQAECQIPGVGWEDLAKGREIRVQNRIFSNTEEVAEGTFGSISATALSDGDVVLILTKIKGNNAVITCWVDGVEYALETPVEARTVLAEAVGINLTDVDFIRINGEVAELSRLIGEGDEVEVVYYTTETEFSESAEDVFSHARQYIAGLEETIDILQAQIFELENVELPEPAPTVIFGRFGGRLQVVGLDGDETIQDLLDEYGDLVEYEAVLHNGQLVDENDLDEIYVQNEDSILIVPTTKNGKRVKFLIVED